MLRRQCEHALLLLARRAQTLSASQPARFICRSSRGREMSGHLRGASPDTAVPLSLTRQSPAALGRRYASSSADAALPTGHTVLSGIQCSGTPTLGNYLGALRQWVDMQQDPAHTNIFYAAVDLHTLTVPRPAEELRQNVNETVVALLACGVDPDRSSLFIQSHVQEHTELAWLLSCVTQFNALRFMTQWKTKSKGKALGSAGLFTYPILMAADILLYKATLVPVGEDQIQHLELTRSIAQAFNRQYDADVLVQPAYSLGSAPRIMNLRDPTKKMSKSDAGELNRVILTDSPDRIWEKIKKAKTDSIPTIYYNKEERPGVSNLLSIYHALTPVGSERTMASLEQEMEGLTTADLKKKVADSVIEHLAPIQERMVQLRADPGYVAAVVERGACTARERAQQTLVEVKQAMGLT